MPTIHVALDTSAIETEGYDFRGNKAIRALLDAVDKGLIKVITTEVNDREVRRRIERRAREAAAGIKRAIKEAKVFASSNVIDYAALKQRFKTADEMVADLQAQWDDFCVKAKVEKLSVETVNANKIFDAYFKQEPPFSPQKDKEFPDAFIIERIRMYAEQQDVDVHVVSNDGDHKAACDGTRLIHAHRIADVLTRVITHDDLAKKALAYLEKDDHIELKEMLSERFPESVSIVIEEDYDADISEVSASEQQMKMVKLEAISTEDEQVEFEGVMEVEFEVSANVGDYENGVREGGEWVFVVRHDEVYKSKKRVRFSASVMLVDFEPDNIFDLSIIEPDVITLNSGNSQIERIEEEPDYDPYDH